MINYQVLENLVGTDKGKRKRFVEHILGTKANRPLSYFREHDVTFSTAEKICDYFSVPMDMLRNAPRTGNNVVGDNNNVGSISINTNLMQENNYLRTQIEALKETIAAKDETIRAKDDILQAYKQLVSNAANSPQPK